MGLRSAPGARSLTAADAAPLVLRALQGGEPVVEVVAVAGPALGRRMLVSPDAVIGSLGSTDLDAFAREAARAAISADRPSAARTTLGSVDHALFLEPHQPPGELVIVGAGHIARPLARIGASLGFQVVVLDDRPEFATRERFPDAHRVLKADFSHPFADVPLSARTHLVLVTRGHKYDYHALRVVLESGVVPAYIGMVGSRRRVRAAFEQLVKEGVPAERLAGIHAPIGLDVGAETPEEIAVAIAAELVLVRRGGTGTPLRDRERVVARWMKDATESRSADSSLRSE